MDSNSFDSFRKFLFKVTYSYRILVFIFILYLYLSISFNKIYIQRIKKVFNHGLQSGHMTLEQFSKTHFYNKLDQTERECKYSLNE
jgi:hypothetical protein